MSGLMRRLSGVLAAAAVVAGCQLLDDLDGAPLDVEAADPSGGAQAPRTLPELVEEADMLAREWQREPVLAEVTIFLQPGGGWSDAELTYVAGDADRLLSVRREDGALRQERLTLETLGLEPLPAAAVAAIPPLPDATREPADLTGAAEPELAGCLAGPPTRVAYATGAPTAWDGAAWIQEPRWLATVWHSDDGAAQGRAFDPVTAEPVDAECVTVE